MNYKLKNYIALSLILQIILVMWLAGHSEWIETYYSNGIYPYISRFFRVLYGWLPFSIGDLIYAAILILGLTYLVQNLKQIKLKPLFFLRDIILVLSVFYFTFNLVWGLNYYRKPLAENFAIKDSVQTAEVLTLSKQLVKKVNLLQEEITGDTITMVQVPYTRNEIFEKTIEDYHQTSSETTFLEYKNASLKKSVFSLLSCYLGIGGYLNPFTNEAQVNAKTPVFRFPVVAAHEVGHQVGYAKENETNFIGYYMTMKSEDIYFQYAAYAYGLSHCLSAVKRYDEAVFNEIFEGVNQGVRANYRELYEFNQKYQNPFEPIFKSIFNTFLKANQQKDGIESYSKIVELMVGYHEKYPL